MKITFVGWGAEQLAITLLSKLAERRGHEVNLAFSAALFKDHAFEPLIRLFDDTEDVLELIRKQKPDVIAFSPLTASFQWMLMIARETKHLFPDVKTVFGGVHVSAVPDLVVQKQEVDYVVVGEGEFAFLEILESLNKADFYTPIQNTRFKNPEGEIVRGTQVGFNQDLDSLPFFTKELWEKQTHVGGYIMTMASRGCVYRCSFCFNNFFADIPDDNKNKGKYVRSRSVQHFINELKIIKEAYNDIYVFDFQDDIFTVDKLWLKEFLQVYKKEIGIPFQCLTHAKFMDQEIAIWLKEAGCIWIQIGIESMDTAFKKSALKRYETEENTANALRYMINAGLKVKADHMLGLPGEPLMAQEKARQIYALHCPTRIQVFWTSFLPGTEILKKGVASGIVSKEQEIRLNEGLDFYYFNNPDNIKDKLLIRQYQGYELLFKLYPLLPKSLRVRLKEPSVRWIPAKPKKAIGMIADLLNGTINSNPEIKSYIKYYWFHSWRILKRRIESKN